MVSKRNSTLLLLAILVKVPINSENDLLSIRVPDSFGRGYENVVGNVAPEIHCSRDGSLDGQLYLEGAHFSDGGHPIISMFFDAVFDAENNENDERFQMSLSGTPQPGRMRTAPDGTGYHHHYDYSRMCRDRIVDGVATSGMGDIFRVIANVTRI